MKIFTKSLVVLVMMTAMAALTRAETTEDMMSRLGKASGKAYVTPLVSAFGSNMNASWYHKIPVAKRYEFHLEAGAVSMGTFLGGGKKNMTVTDAFRLDSSGSRAVANKMNTGGLDPASAQRLRDSVTARLKREESQVIISGPTVLGAGSDTVRYYFGARTLVVGKPGGDTTVTLASDTGSLQVVGILSDFAKFPFTMFAPQFTLGTVYGTNLTLRWLPENETVEEIGTVSFFGVGIQHNPAVWLKKPLPVDLSVGYFAQTLEVGTLFKATSQAFSLDVSKTFGWPFANISPYGGLQYETSSFDFAYDFEKNGESYPVKFSMEGENRYRVRAGVGARLLALTVNGDFSYAQYPSYGFGVMIGI